MLLKLTTGFNFNNNFAQSTNTSKYLSFIVKVLNQFPPTNDSPIYYALN